MSSGGAKKKKKKVRLSGLTVVSVVVAEGGNTSSRIMGSLAVWVDGGCWQNKREED